MVSEKLRTTLAGIGFTFAIAFGMVLFSGVEANAQDRGDRNDRYSDSDRDDGRYEDRNSKSYRKAVKRGYRDGIREGREDARRAGRALRRSRQYRDGNDGYNSRRGDRYAYQQAYRTGFERGYRDGLNGRNNRGEY